jgi:phage-related protein/SLT domain-containing protein
VTLPTGGTLARASVEVVLQLKGAEQLQARIKAAAKGAERQLRKSFNEAERSAKKNARNIAQAFERAAARAEKALDRLSGRDFVVTVAVLSNDGKALNGPDSPIADLRKDLSELSKKRQAKVEVDIESKGGGDLLKGLEAQLARLTKGRKAAIEFGANLDTTKIDRQIAALRETNLRERATRGGITIPVDAKVNVDVELTGESLLKDLEKQLARLQRAKKATIELDAHLDTTELDAEIARLRARIAAERISQTGIRIPVRVDDRPFTRFVKNIRANLSDLDGRFDKFGSGLAKVFGAVGKGLGKLSSSLLSFIKVFGKVTGIATLVVGAIGLVGGAFSSLLATLPPLIGLIDLLSGSLAVLPAGLALLGASVATLVIGFQGMGAAIKGIKAANLTGDTKKLDKALKDLAPSARDTVKEFIKLGPAFTKLRLRVQQELFSGLATTLRTTATKLLPVLSTGFTNLAKDFNAGAKIFAKGLVSPDSLRDTRTTFSNFDKALKALLPAIDPIRRALTDVVTVGSSKLPSLATSLAKVSQRIADAINRARVSGALSDFLDRGIDAAGRFFHVLGNVGGALAGISRAARSAGAGLLTSLERSTKALRDFINSAEGQNDLGDFFASLSNAAKAFAPVLHQLVTTITQNLAPGFAQIAERLAPALAGAIGLIGDAFTAALPGINIFAIDLSSAFTDPALRQSIIEIGQLLGEAFADIGTQAVPIITALTRILKAVLPLVGPLSRLAASVATLIADLSEAIAPNLATVLDTLAIAVQRVAPGLTQLAGEIFKALADPATQKFIIDFFTLLGQLMAGLAPIIVPLVKIIVSLADALVTMKDNLGLAITAVALLTAAAFVLGGPLAALVVLIGGLTFIIATKGIPAFLHLGAAISTGFTDKVVGATKSIFSLNGDLDELATKAQEEAGLLFHIGGALQTALINATSAVKDSFNDLPPSLARAGGRAGAAAGQALVDNLRAKLAAANNFQVNVQVNASINGPAKKVFMAGGIVESPTVALIGEQNRREVVLPLTNPTRLRQLLSDPRVANPINAATQTEPSTGTTINQTFNLTTPQVDMPALAAMVSARMLAGVR